MAFDFKSLQGFLREVANFDSKMDELKTQQQSTKTALADALAQIAIENGIASEVANRLAKAQKKA